VAPNPIVEQARAFISAIDICKLWPLCMHYHTECGNETRQQFDLTLRLNVGAVCISSARTDLRRRPVLLS